MYISNFIQKTKLLIATCRPKQWSKNLLCTSALIITPVSIEQNFSKIFLSTICFILASSFIYIINDNVDYKLDKNHPTKKLRPIPSGKLKKSESLIFGIVILLVSLFLAFSVNNLVLLTISSYVILQLIYCVWGKTKSIIDIYFIASGFILRAFIGVAAMNTYLSPWFLITAGSLALFLAIQKRKSELIRVNESNDISKKSRKVLASYTESFLDKIELISLNSGFLSYMLWASGPILNGAKSSQMLITCPILLMGIFRYQLVSSRKKDEVLLGESPTRILFKDKAIQLIVLTWGLTSWFIIHII